MGVPGAKFFLRAGNHSGDSCGPGHLQRPLSVGTVILVTFGLNEIRDDSFLKTDFQTMDPKNGETDIV